MPIATSILQTSLAWRWLRHMGGPGLLLMGIGDSSPLPLPGGSADVLALVLAARRREWWGYYALMATVGSVLGSYLAYRFAEASGARALVKRLGTARTEAAMRRLTKHGWATVAVGALLPPPFPFAAVVMAAGIVRYPRAHFLAALVPARLARYALVTYLGYRYGRAILRAFRNLQPTPGHVAEVAVGLAALVVATWLTMRVCGHKKRAAAMR